MFVFSVTTIFISGLLCLRKDIRNSKLYFVLISGVVLCLYSALRGHDLQPDIPSYVNFYDRYAEYSLSEILALYSSEIRDPTYYFTAWLFSRIFTNAQWWIAFVAAVYIVIALIIIYKESDNPLLSVLMIVSLGYLFFILNGLRQCFAMSFVMLSYLFLKNKKPVKFFMMVLIASLFHLSAIVFLIMYPICRSKLGVWHIVSFLILLVLFLAFSQLLGIYCQEYWAIHNM